MPPKKPTRDAKKKPPPPCSCNYQNFALSIVERKQQEKRGAISTELLKVLEEGYVKLLMSDSQSLLKKYLTREIFYKIKDRRTPIFGSTLLDCVQSGFDNHDSSIGVYAPDPQAYSVFAELFDPIIEEYHKGFKKTDKHPPRNFGDTNKFGDLDPMGDYIISTRVRVGRSIKGYPFAPCMTGKQYRNLQRSISLALEKLEGELKGKFYPLSEMPSDAQQKLIDKHYLFIQGDRFLQAANACRYWPTGRAIYYNDNKTFLIWCNEEDHIRIISMERFGNLGNVYRRLVAGVSEIEKRLPFSHHSRLGFLSVCPTNLGTAIRASVHIKLPNLSTNRAKLYELAKRFNLQIRGSRGEHTDNDDGIYDISNQRRLGLTEFEAVQEMYNGITELIKIERSM